MDLATTITDYENGELAWHEELELFQHLIDTGLAWTLQGRYGRQALLYLREGLIAPPMAEAEPAPAVLDDAIPY